MTGPAPDPAPAARNAPTLRLEVRLWIAPGETAGFRAFEDRALAIMAEHGAQVTVRPGPGTPGGPDEIHDILFPDAAAVAAYRADPRLAALAEQRACAVARTEIIEHPERPGPAAP